MDALRAQLTKATSSHGIKMDLARWLADKLPGQAGSYHVTVLDFLSGKSNPGGEITLALMEWLDGQATTSRKRGRKLVRNN